MKIFEGQNVPIKSWCNNPEDGAIEQAKNLASLPFIFKQINLMPDTHQGYGMPIGGVIATKGVIIPNAVGVDIGCFSGDTKVPLLNGSERTLKDLTKENKPFYVYSVNENKEITGGLAISRRTRKNAELIKIILDNNAVIKCTLDHKFMLRNGEYCEAQHLEVGNSLMPLYRNYDKDGYEKIYNPKTKTYQRTHWLLARTGALGEIPYFVNQKTIIHHSDFNPRNNAPNNLKFMGNRDHSKYHRSLVERNEHWQSKDFEAKRIASIKYKIKTDKKFKEQKQRQGKKNILKYMREKRNDFLEKVKDNGKRGRLFLIDYNKSKKGRQKSKEISNRLYDCNICGESVKSPIGLYNHNRSVHNNHKIIKIVKLNKREDVYCLTVNKYHNFALSSGIFVHNCGMCAMKTSLKDLSIEQLKKILGGSKEYKGGIRSSIPVGFNHHSKKQDENLMPKDSSIIDNSTIICQEYNSALKQIGTLGGGNHFIEIQKGSDGYIWIMIHSGSRNLGYKVAKHYNELAQTLCKKWHSNIPEFKGEDGLAFLPLDSEEGQSYLREMNYCLEFAFASRKLMMERVLDAIVNMLKDGENKEGICYADLYDSEIINIHHNYASMENHFGQNVMVHRKGATSAKEGQFGIIPGSQGTASFIVIGKGNEESFMSCSHGAGRAMSRKKARENLNLEEEQRKMDDKGILHALRGKNGLDEASGAYKDISVVMDEQKDLVEILVELHPLAVVKG